MRRLISILCIAMMLSLASAACGKHGSQPSITPPEQKSERATKPKSYQVDIINFSFSPQTP